MIRPVKPAKPVVVKHSRQELWSKFLRTRWKKDRNQLVELYMPLVRSVAEQLVCKLPRSVDADDMVSVGVFGLLQSIENFDPERGVKFETYCRARIRGAMIDDLRTQDLLSRDARERANHVGAAVQRLRHELGREPIRVELCAATGLQVRELDETLRKVALQVMISLDSGVSDSLRRTDRGAVSEDLIDAELEPLEILHQKDLLHLIGRNLNTLERQILLLRYRDGLTMRNIGTRLDLSESRVCQVHSGLLARLYRRLSTEA